MNVTYYYWSIILCVAGFAAGPWLISHNLTVLPPLDQKMIIVDRYDTIRFSDTLVFSNRMLDFKMKQYHGDSLKVAKKTREQVVLYQEFFFNNHPKLMLWALFISISLGLVGAFIPILFFYVKQLERHERYGMPLLALGSMGVVFFLAHYGVNGMDMLPPRIMSVLHILFDQNAYVLDYIIGFFLVPPFLALINNIKVTKRLMRISERKEPCDYRVLKILKNRSFLFLLAAAVMLVMGIITSSLLRKAVLEALGEGYAYFFPTEFVTSYSLIFTFFLLVFFGPSVMLINELSKRSAVRQKMMDAGGRGIASGYSVAEVFELGIAFLSPILFEIVMGAIT